MTSHGSIFGFNSMQSKTNMEVDLDLFGRAGFDFPLAQLSDAISICQMPSKPAHLLAQFGN